MIMSVDHIDHFTHPLRVWLENIFFPERAHTGVDDKGSNARLVKNQPLPIQDGYQVEQGFAEVGHVMYKLDKEVAYIDSGASATAHHRAFASFEQDRKATVL